MSTETPPPPSSSHPPPPPSSSHPPPPLSSNPPSPPPPPTSSSDPPQLPTTTPPPLPPPPSSSDPPPPLSSNPPSPPPPPTSYSDPPPLPTTPPSSEPPPPPSSSDPPPLPTTPPSSDPPPPPLTPPPLASDPPSPPPPPQPSSCNSPSLPPPPTSSSYPPPPPPSSSDPPQPSSSDPPQPLPPQPPSSSDTPPPPPISSGLPSVKASSTPEIIEENPPQNNTPSIQPTQNQNTHDNQTQQKPSSPITPITQNQNTLVNKTRKKPSTSITPTFKKFSVRRLRGYFTRKPKRKPADNNNNSSTSRSSGPEEIQTLVKLIGTDIGYITKASDNIGKYKENVAQQLNEVSKKFEKLKGTSKKKDLEELNRTVTKLKLMATSKYKVEDEEKGRRNQQPGGAAKSKEDIPKEVLEKMPQLYTASTFEQSSEFKDFVARYNKLSIKLKLCLLCFSVFPENAIIKKRLMVYWWIGEGFVTPIETSGEGPNPGTDEEYGKELFDNLMELGFIEPVYKTRSLIVGSCRMHPFIRSSLVTLAKRAKFFDFDSSGNPMEDFSISYRACLSGLGLLKKTIPILGKLHMLFNVNEANLEFKPEWLLQMINMNVLYLGRWLASATQHIEVEDTKFLESLVNLIHLKFFSLQGISRITELPDSISNLRNLTILDLRACHNLEVIPEGIGSLKHLTHLDMSECYLLEHMPKGLALLDKLQVLKGFIVGDESAKTSCTIANLAKLQSLIKLSIYTGLKDFPTSEQVRNLQQFPVLLKLTIAWGGGALQDQPENKPHTGKPEDGRDKKRVDGGRAGPKKLKRLNALSIPSLPSNLKKLDLKCYPNKVTPEWLKPAYLKNLKKLYIRGGKFNDIGQFQDIDYMGSREKDKWAVEQLRLKYLSELEMDWRELKELFPDLIYLEKVNCPKLNFFPCDASGVWMNKEKKLKHTA